MYSPKAHMGHIDFEMVAGFLGTSADAVNTIGTTCMSNTSSKVKRTTAITNILTELAVRIDFAMCGCHHLTPAV